MGPEASSVSVRCVKSSVGISGLAVSWTSLGPLCVVLGPERPGEGAALTWEGGPGDTVKASPLLLFLLLRLILSTSMGKKRQQKPDKCINRFNRFFKCHCSSFCWSRGEVLGIFKMSAPPRRLRCFSLVLALEKALQLPHGPPVQHGTVSAARASGSPWKP